MRKYITLIQALVLLLAGFACDPDAGQVGMPTPVETDACCLNEQPGLAETLAADARAQSIGGADDPSAAAAAGGLIRQGAAFSRLDPYWIDDVAAGSYRADFTACGNGYLANLPDEGGEIVLTLTYATPLLPAQLEIYTAGPPDGIRRVELLSSLSGLGRLAYETGAPVRRDPLAEGACAERLVLPVEADFEVDTVFITFDSPAAAAQVGAVELLGSLDLFADAPVAWSVALPGVPVDVAAGRDGRVYVAVEPNGLYAFDEQGRLAHQFSVPSVSRLTSVEVDPAGNLVVTDAVYNWYIVLSPEGEQLAAGGGDAYYRAAVSPLDGNIYMWKGGAIDVYAPGAASPIRSLPLDGARSYLGLAFDPRGRLFTLRDYDWSGVLLELDPLTGEEIDATPLERTEQVEIVTRDLAIDAGGNFCILFSLNAGQVAVHRLDPQGNLAQRFGRLASGAEEHAPGVFLDPRAISVSPDGRFVFIVDGYAESATLTALLLEVP